MPDKSGRIRRFATGRRLEKRRMGMSTATNRTEGAIDVDSFGSIYDRSFNEIYRYLCKAVLGDRALAEDLTQETFEAVVAAVKAGRTDVSTAWMIGIARHKLI